MARASAAQGDVALEERKAQCDLLIKALVALTAQDERTLRDELAEKTAQLPVPAGISVNTVPAEVLGQRPDIHAAAVSYTHLTLPTNNPWCRSRWSPYH